MKKYSCYEYKVTKCRPGWDYAIYGETYMQGYTIIRESSEWHETEAKAESAARAHIDKLESGEG